MTATPAPLVLVVEDDWPVAEVQIDHLRAAGLRVQHLAHGDAVAAAVRAAQPALVILDVELPGQDGTAICRALRRFSDVPIVMVTARAGEGDRLLGFDVGADDYLCKPFSPRELVARVQALLRRRAAAPADEASQPLQVDAACQRIAWRGQALDLTPQEYRLLAVLAGHPGRVFSRAQLLQQAYDDPAGVFDRAVDSHVKNLRRKLAAIEPGVDLIHSVYGQGYRFEAPAASAAAEPATAPEAAGAADLALVPIELEHRLAAFLSSRHAAIDEMDAALARADLAAARALAHRLAGSFALYGFVQAARASQRIEHGAATEDAARLLERVRALRAHLAGVRVQFVDEEGRPLPPAG
jgi:DNA-binding response OmpR family regulator/HPt (histidine-containing phosphotransfer) domain-containing protein